MVKIRSTRFGKVNVAQMVNDIFVANSFIPILNNLLVHLFSGTERSIGICDNILMTKVQLMRVRNNIDFSTSNSLTRINLLSLLSILNHFYIPLLIVNTFVVLSTLYYKRLSFEATPLKFENPHQHIYFFSSSHYHYE